MSVGGLSPPATEQYNARAQKRWLGVVDFNFLLEWEATNGASRPARRRTPTCWCWGMCIASFDLSRRARQS